MKIVLLPLDERPCNGLYPNELPLKEGITLVVPPRTLLSNKKEVCDISLLNKWLIEECKDADYALLALDTLLYGGIVPSRLHHEDYETLIKRSENLQVLKQNNPKLKIFVNELIMRTPSYSNATEEPDYFDNYGKELWQYGYYLDKEKQGIITKNEKRKMDVLYNYIPNEFLTDLMNRREINRRVTIHNLNYVKSGVIDYFIIPQDDCAPFGFTSIDRREINKFLVEQGLDEKIVTYPGADEAGMVLISKALNDYFKNTPKVYVKYACEEGKESIPEYEDRPIDASLSAHIHISGAIRTYEYEEADMVLAVNLAKEFLPMYDENIEKNLRDRDLESFVRFIKKAKEDGKVVGITDIAICNRGDMYLFKALQSNNMLNSIDAYAGWNTASNSTGTTVAMMTAYYYSRDDEKKTYTLFCRYIEDFFYMGPIRDEINKIIDVHQEWKVHIENLSYMNSVFVQLVEEKLDHTINFYKLKDIYNCQDLSVYFPWNRTFEVAVVVK